MFKTGVICERRIVLNTGDEALLDMNRVCFEVSKVSK